MKLFLALSLLVFSFASSAKMTRLKEVVDVKGVRDNPLVGYGLVIGLNGTGDGGGEITNTSLKRMFQKLGLNPQSEVTSKNVAAVIVTAKLPPFGRLGQKLDITVSSIGDASSLAGGTLLVTPLKGGDGNVYGVASGPLSIGGLKRGSKFATTGSIPGGATIERELEVNFDKKDSLRLSLKNPDFTTAARVERTINQELGGKYAIAKDATTVDLIIPVQYKRKVVQLMAIVENFQVTTDRIAKIVINEKTGTIVAGGDVELKPVAISHGDLSIEIKGDAGEAKPGNVYFVDKKSTLNDLVKSLNAFGATPEDLISIFQTLKRNGALIGEIELI
ncbi:flagellar basal body P-ring protein FlgI [Bacteriovorax sp. Seq25_V]|uniref:flagellar basal body P-ring protein FlgI n=1 Tax=Bacteriovorax sp. Seq25_V TaxID=1201288 RepID=UPI00038A18F2|nr:flagellar basal body P-ring protein FlgI [Bacteriovorax sp. Seq25_V]EQC43231.1 flagellar P-ring protein FlgI [Bacteriovorax sp. Seq25_V]